MDGHTRGSGASSLPATAPLLLIILLIPMLLLLLPPYVQVRAELSSKMVVASSADDLSDVRGLQLVGKGTFGRVYKGEQRCERGTRLGRAGDWAGPGTSILGPRPAGSRNRMGGRWAGGGAW